ncbi:MAG: RIP metalloprotease RseP [Deltaproteobacteria bacterium]|nr:MAG: RIP metalloprotease RseP [Deltaproteobacteria bacterium]
MWSIVGAIVAIGLLIIVHEGGHYLVARWCKMRVDRFSIGFGPAILKWRRGDTDFVVAPIPFGGYVQIAGMNVAEDVDPDDDRAYPNRPVWQRFATIFAGPGTNYLFAAVLAFGLYATSGAPTGTVWYRVAGTTEGYDAHGKLLPGDRILKVNDQLVYMAHPQADRLPRLTEVVYAERKRTGGTVRITVLRDGKEVVVPITPQPAPPGQEMFRIVRDYCGEPCAVYHLGIALDQRGDVERVPIGVVASAREALAYPVRQTALIVGGLWEVARGRAEAELLGPVGITTAVESQFQFGWVRVVELLMMLNVYLGLFNLLPLPALDGGRLAFLGYEMATRRRANPKVEATVHMIGIMALLLLMLFVTYRDIARLF